MNWQSLIQKVNQHKTRTKDMTSLDSQRLHDSWELAVVEKLLNLEDSLLKIEGVLLRLEQELWVRDSQELR